MSGPKEGYYTNYQAECENLKDRLNNLVLEIGKLQKDVGNFKIESIDQEMGLRFLGVDLEGEKAEVEKALGKLVNEANKLLEEAKSISSYNRKSLKALQDIHQRMDELRKKAKQLQNAFRSRVFEIQKQSQEQAEKLRDRLLSEMEAYLNSEDFEFINKWCSRVDHLLYLREATVQAKKADLKAVENIYKKFYEIAEKLQDEALKNKEYFELKKDTSSKIMKVLAEQNYVNLERRIEGDRFGPIVVVAESPSGNWQLTFKVENNGEIKIITPYDERCYTELEQIGENLKSIGLEISIKQLEEWKSKKKEGDGRARIEEKTRLRSD